MTRSNRLTAVVVGAVLVLLALSAWLRSWGGLALVVLGAAGFAWYRVQVARSEAGEQPFFGDMGEETRMPHMHAGSPSEMPLERTMPGRQVPPGGPGRG